MITGIFPEGNPEIMSECSAPDPTALSSIFQLTDQEIFVITSRYGTQIAGQVATWVMPASLIPERLRLVVTLSPQNATTAIIRQSRQLVIQLLAAEQAALMFKFGYYSSRDYDKFEGLALQSSTAGLPVLPQTCGWVDCQVKVWTDLGDRCLLVVDVVEQVYYPNRQPLREQAAFASLTPDQRQKLAEKFQRDIDKARQLWRAL
jgi:flavin reductase (DIM6/NTAB) family NADH-FMN oxidoreductase RutF